MALVCSVFDVGRYVAQPPTAMLVSACLLIAFFVVAILSFSQSRRMRGQLNRLSDEARARRAQDEELANIGSRPTASRMRANPWDD